MFKPGTTFESCAISSDYIKPLWTKWKCKSTIITHIITWLLEFNNLQFHLFSRPCMFARIIYFTIQRFQLHKGHEFAKPRSETNGIYFLIVIGIIDKSFRRASKLYYTTYKIIRMEDIYIIYYFKYVFCQFKSIPRDMQ